MTYGVSDSPTHAWQLLLELLWPNWPNVILVIP